MDVLDGFKPVDPSNVRISGRRFSSCGSRLILQAFLDSGHEAIAKKMESEDLEREAYNLRHYRKRHIDEFSGVGISTRNGQLTLFRMLD